MEFVEKNYGKLPTRQIADFLGRGIPAVRAMALKLGIGRTGAKPWSPAEIDVVKNIIHMVLVLSWCRHCCRIVIRNLSENRQLKSV